MLFCGGSHPLAHSPIPLFAGELAYSQQPAQLFTYCGQDVNYDQHVLAFGRQLLFMATLGISTVANRSRRRQAERAAAPQWRAINHGRAFLTNRRVAIQGTNGWADLWLEHLRHVEPIAPRGMVLFFDGVVPYQLALPWPEYHVVLLRFLAWGERPGSSPTGDPPLGGGARGSLGPGGCS